MKPILYIGCSLTQAPEEFKAAVEKLKDSLRPDYEVMDFLGLIKGTPADVYHSDIETNVGGCDLLVAICDYPSIGLGYEIAAAIERFKKPVLAVAHKDVRITRMLLGIPSELYSIKRYQDLNEVPQLIADKLRK